MNFAVLAPEINSLRIYLGAGSAPMFLAAESWSGLADELNTAAISFSSLISDLAGQEGWQGLAASAMKVAAASLLASLQAASHGAETTAGQVATVASAYEAAKAQVIPPQVVHANRELFVDLVRSNFFGLNAPAIAAVESAYEEFWAADVRAMVGYHEQAAAAAAQVATWPQVLQGLPDTKHLLGASKIAPGASDNTNLGIGNKGSGNIGNGNTSGIGAGNIGNGNTGNSNLGGGNIGDGNIGIGNSGDGNFGLGNRGNGNIGLGNTGVGDNSGGGNVGFGNHGNNNVGFGNTGSWNQGAGNTGNNNIGFGLTGDNMIGLGNAYFDRGTGNFVLNGLNSGIGNIGFGNSGNGNIGFFNSGDGNIGFFNSGANLLSSDLGRPQSLGLGNAGFGNVGFGNSGEGNFGFGNAGDLNTGFGNAGNFNTGVGNSGFFNTGLNNSGYANTFNGNSGNINTGLWNSGNHNNGIGYMSDASGPNSGVGNTGDNVSGFYNHVGHGNLGTSGFFNTATGGNIVNGWMSGFFNTGTPASQPPVVPPPFTASGVTSGLLNYGSFAASLLNIMHQLRN